MELVLPTCFVHIWFHCSAGAVESVSCKHGEVDAVQTWHAHDLEEPVAAVLQLGGELGRLFYGQRAGAPKGDVHHGSRWLAI